MTPVSLNPKPSIAMVNPHFHYMGGGAEVCDKFLGIAFRSLGYQVDHYCVSDPARPPLHHANLPSRAVIMPYVYDQALRRKGITGKFLRARFEQRFLNHLVHQHRERLTQTEWIFLTGRPLLAKLKKQVHRPLIQSIRGLPNPWFRRFYSIPDGLIFWGGCEERHPPAALAGIRSIACDCAIDPTLFYPGPPVAALRNELQGGNPNATVLLFAGRLDPVKQVDRIILACSRLIKEGFLIQLVLAGEGSMKESLHQLAQKNQIEKHVLFRGYVDAPQLAELYRASDMFVLNSKFENFSIVLKEAVACGTYALVPKTGSTPRLLAATGFGRLLDRDDVDSLTTALREALVTQAFEKSKRPQEAPPFETWDETARRILEWCRTL